MYIETLVCGKAHRIRSRETCELSMKNKYLKTGIYYQVIIRNQICSGLVGVCIAINIVHPDISVTRNFAYVMNYYVSNPPSLDPDYILMEG